MFLYSGLSVRLFSIEETQRQRSLDYLDGQVNLPGMAGGRPGRTDTGRVVSPCRGL